MTDSTHKEGIDFPSQQTDALEALLLQEPCPTKRVIIATSLIMNRLAELETDGFEVGIGPFTVSVQAAVTDSTEPFITKH